MKRLSLLSLAIVLTAAGFSLVACASGPEPKPTISPSQEPDAFLAEARTYCTDSGGVREMRQPTYGTNLDSSQWIPLGEPVEVCTFSANDEAHSRITLDLTTLYSPKPTLAALAYLSRTPIPYDGGPVNPAYLLCVALGGAELYGMAANGGGLVAPGSEADPDVVSPCTFADGSFIDDWGIAYFASGTIRGADLSALFRFDTQKAPTIFD